MDFEIAGVTQVRLAAWIEANLAYDQLIVEYPQADCVSAGWLHVSYARGHNRKQTLTKTQTGYSPGFPPLW